MASVIIVKDFGKLKEGTIIEKCDHFAARHLVQRGLAEYTEDAKKKQPAVTPKPKATTRKKETSK